MEKKVTLFVAHDVLVLEYRMEVCALGLKLQDISLSGGIICNCCGKNLLSAINIDLLHVAHEQRKISG